MRVAFLGPPGSGKGTQAGLLAGQYVLPVVSTGELLRAISRNGPTLDPEVEAIHAGHMVSDDTVNRIVAGALPGAPAGFCLDGYPRTIGQALYLDDLGNRVGWKIDRVVVLDVPDSELRRRLTVRGRRDDEEDGRELRLELYRRHSASVYSHYRLDNRLLVVDGIGPIDVVHSRVCSQLAGHV